MFYFMKLDQQRVYRFFPKGDAVTARERTDLPPDQQRRWDYFYRPDIDLVYQIQLDDLIKAQARQSVDQKLFDALSKQVADCELARSAAQAKKRIGWLLIGLVWVVFVISLLATSVANQGVPKSSETLLIVAFMGGIFSLIVSGVIYFVWGQELEDLEAKLSSLKQKLRSKEAELKMRTDELEEVKAVRSDLMAQVAKSPAPPSDDEMLEFWAESLEKLAAQAMKECNVSPSDLLDSSHRIQFAEWGCLQDRSRSGYEMLDNYEERHQALAITNSGRLVYCSNYVEFIFLTDKNIDIYGTFFDMIGGVNCGERVVTYYYQHVTNIETKIGIVDLDFLGVYRQEAMSIVLRVASGDCVRVTLTDEDIQRQIGALASEDSQELELALKNLRGELERAQDEEQKKGIKKRIEKIESRRVTSSTSKELESLRDQLEKAASESEREYLKKEIDVLERKPAPSPKEKKTIRTEDTRGKARAAVRTIRSRITEMQKTAQGTAGALGTF